MRTLASTAIVLFLLAAATPLKATPGPARSIGPEGYADNLVDIRHPDPQDPSLLMAVTNSGIWTSRDGGASWREASASLPESGTVLEVAVDQLDRRHWRVLTLDQHLPLNRLAETRDAGSSWSVRDLPGHDFRSIRIDSQTPNLLLLAASHDIWRSLDGGASWEKIAPAGLPCCFPQVGLHDEQGGRFWVSYDEQLFSLAAATADWRKISTLPPGIREILSDLRRPGTIFLRGYGELFRSTDGGLSFDSLLRENGLLDLRQSAKNPDHLAVLRFDSLHLSSDGGATWTAERLNARLSSWATDFDPVSGDLLLNLEEVFARRRPDGTITFFRPRGLFAMAVVDAFLDAGSGDLYLLTRAGATFRRDARSRWDKKGRLYCDLALAIATAPWDPDRVYATCGDSYQTSSDGADSWAPAVRTQSSIYPPNRFLFLPGEMPSVFLLERGSSVTSLEGPLDVTLGRALAAFVDEDPEAGLTAIRKNGQGGVSLLQWRAPGPWLPVAQWPDDQDEFPLFGRDEADPDHLLRIGGSGGRVHVSFDRGATWQERASVPQAGVSALALVDPNERRRYVAGGGDTPLFESDDGAQSWRPISELRDSRSAFFDAASNLYGATSAGLLMRSPETEPCAGREDNFCAREARFEVTVEYQTPGDPARMARKVETGSEESGIFSFFDADNWELLVKVLDGCAINQRFWVFSAGTTDVEYLVKVEDRWTGRIRSYWSAPGQPARAVADIDAFATCAEPAPAGAARREPKPAAFQAIAVDRGGATPALELQNGRFRVEADWTDFQGNRGPAAPAPLLGSSAGLFYFFSPDNWELMVKVLDGCAINGYYWLLSAATTTVGYELRVEETATGLVRTFGNPVGQAAPAKIELEAFACGETDSTISRRRPRSSENGPAARL